MRKCLKENCCLWYCGYPELRLSVKHHLALGLMRSLSLLWDGGKTSIACLFDLNPVNPTGKKAFNHLIATCSHGQKSGGGGGGGGTIWKVGDIISKYQMSHTILGLYDYSLKWGSFFHVSFPALFYYFYYY